jgi:muconate cycloisomerase
MRVSFRQIPLEKRYPLRISRGVHTGSINLFVFVEDGSMQGIGEMAPGALTGCATAEEGEAALRAFTDHLPNAPVQEIHQRALDAGVAPCALAALDMALWDLLAKQAGMPLYQLLGLSRRSVPTSVTIGINPPEVIRERVPEILERTGAKYLKVKLGSGVESDRESYTAAMEAARPFGAGLRVDANGGWSLKDARAMMRWLEERGADYVEQPLSQDDLADLPALSRDRPLPIFLDESCRFSADIPRFAPYVDGVNLKLMKCGGITEALRIVATARAFGLSTMIGCMGESSLSISAGASIGSLFDHIDLDSHLNLVRDPAVGAELIDGVVTPPELPGHGGRIRDDR